MKKLFILLLLLPFFAKAQTTYQLNYDSIRVNKTAGTGGTSLYGKVYLKNVTARAVGDSILSVLNGRIFKVPFSDVNYWSRSGDTLSPVNIGDKLYFSKSASISDGFTHVTLRDTLTYLNSTGQDSYGEAVTFSGRKIGGTRTGLQWGKFITSQVDASNTADWLYSGFYLHPNLVGVAGNTRITGSGDVYDAASFSAFTNYNSSGDLTYRYGLTIAPTNIGGSGSLLNERGIVIGDLSGTVSTMPIESVGNDPSSFAGRIDYKTNIGAQFTTRSLIDKGYADSAALLRVPYSGATGNVNLGIYSITGVAGNFSGSVKAGDATGVLGYTLQAKAATNKRIGFSDGGSYGTWSFFNDANSYTTGGIDASTLNINGLTSGITNISGRLGVAGSPVTGYFADFKAATNRWAGFANGTNGAAIIGHTDANSFAALELDGSTLYLNANSGGALRIPTGANTGYVLTSDATGLATWQSTASGLSYKGTWNASTNTPTLADGTGTNGDMYSVSAGGTQFSRTFVTGGFAIYNGSIWEAVGSSSGVTSITGTSNQVTASASTGAVTLSLPQSIATSSALQFGSLGIGAAVLSGYELDVKTATDKWLGVNSGTNGTGIIAHTDANAFTGLELDGSKTYINAASGGEVLINTTTDAGDFKLQVSGNANITGDASVADEVYGSGWNGSLEVPTKNAVYDKVETLAPLASPTFTGTVTIPNGSSLGTPTTLVGTNITGTASGLTAGTVTTNANLTGVVTSTGNATAIADAALSIAKTSGLQSALDLKAALASPTFTGTPTLPTGTIAVTQSANDNSTKLATTAYVDGASKFNKIQTLSSNTTLDGTHETVLINTSGGAVTITLPLANASSVWDSANSRGKSYFIKRITAPGNDVTITPSGSDTIDGGIGYVLVSPNYIGIRIQTNGTNWYLTSKVD